MNFGARISVDFRSVNMARTTGWERYTRNLFAGLEVSKFNVDVRSPHQAALRSFGVTTNASWLHFPSYPPRFAFDYEKTIFTLHDSVWWDMPETSSKLGLSLFRPLAERAISNGCQVLTVSEFSAARISEIFGLERNRIHIVSPGVSLFDGNGEKYERVSRPFLLTVGSVEPRKNYGFMIEAYEQSLLSKTHDLVIVGRHAWSEVVDEKYIHTAVSDANLAWLYRNCDLFLSTSIFEGFGMPVAEALSFGALTLCSAIPAYLEISHPNLIHLPLELNSWVEYLDKHVSQPTSHHSNSKPVSTYTWNSSKTQLRQAYEKIGVETFNLDA